MIQYVIAPTIQAEEQVH